MIHDEGIKMASEKPSPTQKNGALGSVLTSGALLRAQDCAATVPCAARSALLENIRYADFFFKFDFASFGLFKALIRPSEFGIRNS